MSETQLKVLKIKAQQATPESLAPFGEPLDLDGGLVLDPNYLNEAEISEAGAAIRVADINLELETGDGKPTLMFLTMKQRPIRFHSLFRHVKTTQLLLPLERRRYVAVVGLPRHLEDPNAVPRPEDLRAFIVPPGMGVNLKKGTWHIYPYPLEGGGMSMLTIIRFKDLESYIGKVDFRQSLGIEFEVET